MSNMVILDEQTISFSENSSFGCYIATVSGVNEILTEGETYSVEWDGDVHKFTAAEYAPLGGVGIGNPSILGAGDDTGEDFCIGCIDNRFYLFTTDTASSHTVAIYLGPNTIQVSLYDRTGAQDNYEIGKGIRLFSEDGTAQDFFPGTAEDVTIEPDFSEGDIVVEPSKGAMFESVTIKKPEMLIPENVAEGINIAGVIGSLAAGGGAAKVAFGIVPSSSVSTKQTITHGLGVVPNIILVENIDGGVGTKGKKIGFFSMSRAFATQFGFSTCFKYTSIYDTYGAFRRYNGGDGYMDELISDYVLSSVNTETFLMPAMDSRNYFWIAVAGLV